jgi:hypothetical protein
MATIKIDKFTGIRPNGYFWLENLIPEFIGNKSFIKSGCQISKLARKGETNLSNLGLVIGFDSKVNESSGAILSFALDNTGYFYRSYLVSSWKEFYRNSSDYSAYGDIKFFHINDLEYLLYSGKRYVGKIYVITEGTCDITNPSGNTFRYTISGQGISSSNPSVGDTVKINVASFNSNNNGTFTVTGSGTNYFEVTNANGVVESNKSLNVVTDYICFIDTDFADLGTSSSYDSRQIVIGEDYAYVCNGKYLAAIYKDGTLTANKIQMPSGYKTACLSFNNSRLLIGGNHGNKGIILLWDTESGNFDYIKKFKAPVYSITGYKNGWIVLVGSDFYYTDGYNYQHLTSFIDAEKTSGLGIQVNKNGMLTFKDYLLVNGGYSYLMRLKTGLWVYNLKTGDWSFASYLVDNDNGLTNSGLTTTPGAVYYLPNWFILLGYSVGEYINNQYFIGSIKLDNNPESKVYRELISPVIYFGKRAKINYVILELAYFNCDLNSLYNNTSPFLKIWLKVADSNNKLFTYHQGSANGTLSTIVVNGSYNNNSYGSANVGDEVIVLAGNNTGLRRNIINISNKGQSNETWTLDENLVATSQQYVMYQLTPFKKVDKKEISDFTDNRIYFDCAGFEVSGACLLKFIFQSYYMPFLISSITIDYDFINQLN